MDLVGSYSDSLVRESRLINFDTTLALTVKANLISSDKENRTSRFRESPVRHMAKDCRRVFHHSSWTMEKENPGEMARALGESSVLSPAFPQDKSGTLRLMQVMTLLFGGEMVASHWFILDFGLGMVAVETPPGGSFSVSITCHGHANVGRHANHHLPEHGIQPVSTCHHPVGIVSVYSSVINRSFSPSGSH